jgi:putative drug exporter of the RND superfamily
MTSPASPTPSAGRLARLAGFAVRRRGRMVLAWIAALVLVSAVGPALAGEYDADYATPGSESKAAAELIDERFPGRSDADIDVVWRARGGVDEPAAEAKMERFLADAEQIEAIAGAGDWRVSRDGTIAYASLALDRPGWDVPTSTGEELIDRAEAVSGDGLRIELGGAVIEDAQEGAPPELVGLVAAAFILLIAFGSVVAAGLPLAVALFGLGLSATLIGVLTVVVDIPEWAPAVSSLMGIGVGIDYALLILTRFRTALAGGAATHGAVVEAVATAGRSVVVAGTTVIIALLGLFVVGVSYMNGVAVAAGVSVLIVMLASITLLPALLAYAGARVNRLRIPGFPRLPKSGEGPPIARWSRAVQRRPWTAAIAAAALLLALTAPVLGLRLGFPDAGNDRAGTTTRAAYDLVTRGFGPGANGTLLVAADLPRPESAAALERAAARLRAEPGVSFVSDPQLNPRRDAALLAVAPETSPQDPATADLVRRIRDETLPAALRDSGVDAHVGGVTASVIDQSDYVSKRLPLFVGAVVGTSFLLLLVAFRAPLVAVKAGVMNLLSVGAAYGVVALVAEGGWAGSLIGVETDTPVPPFIPVIMFAILFGLSMDYEVFLLSRIREELTDPDGTAHAVAHGLAKTARVITAAAAIMVAVFMAFVFSSEVFLKLMGVGMAAAILVDATVVRMVLVPALMQLMGRANWWIPHWLDRALPRVGIEPPRASAPSEARS